MCVQPSDESQSDSDISSKVVVLKVFTTVVSYLALHHVANASHHRVLMHIQANTMRIENFHHTSLRRWRGTPIEEI